ncbi:MAG: hypothetical protein ABIB71_00360 [Candidatus Woesearchaeota archaeon]
MPPRENLLHEVVKQELIQHPEVLGIREVATYKEEVPYTNGRRVLGQVDIVFWDLYGKAYAVEVTTGKTQKAKRRLQRQVRNAKKHFRKVIAIGVVNSKEGLEIFRV